MLLALGHWPEAATPKVRAHVAGCKSCSALVVVEMAMRAGRVESIAKARLEPAGLVWWRAQLRKRQEAMTRVSRPIWGAQMFAVVISFCVAAGVGIWQAMYGTGVKTWLQGPQGIASVSMREEWMLGVGVGVLLAMGGLVVYLTVEQE
jgi:hypothetical protein